MEATEEAAPLPAPAVVALGADGIPAAFMMVLVVVKEAAVSISWIGDNNG